MRWFEGRSNMYFNFFHPVQSQFLKNQLLFKVYLRAVVVWYFHAVDVYWRSREDGIKSDLVRGTFLCNFSRFYRDHPTSWGQMGHFTHWALINGIIPERNRLVQYKTIPYIRMVCSSASCYLVIELVIVAKTIRLLRNL